MLASSACISAALAARGESAGGGSLTPLTSAKLPNFLIVGAAKAGTTSMFEYLCQHPEVYMPGNKEPLFFTAPVYAQLGHDDPRREFGKESRVFDLAEYLGLFAAANGRPAIGEASATYLYYHRIAIPRIKELLGDPKIIIMLRDPVARAFSAYRHLVRDGVERLPFHDFLRDEQRRKNNNWDILNMAVDNGFYHDQVKAYLDNFSSVHVIVFRDFARDAVGVVQNTCRFLGVDPGFVPDTSCRHNETTCTRFRALDRFLNHDHPLKLALTNLLRHAVPQRTITGVRSYLNKSTAPQLDEQTARELRATFCEDTLKLQDLIQQDLSHWL